MFKILLLNILRKIVKGFTLILKDGKWEEYYQIHKKQNIWGISK
jgi:hypothetical protein